jgi:hypothetical protein
MGQMTQVCFSKANINVTSKHNTNGGRWPWTMCPHTSKKYQSEWMHIKVVHFLSQNAHFGKMPFLWTPITNNKSNRIENLKLIIH